jgi:phenylalanyl-tRNA synthetase beta chain
MGGEESEIGDGTTNVLLEAAAWNFINIRRSMHALKINSEAGFRFSRGVHPTQALLGAQRAAELMRQLAGGTVRQGIVDYYPNPPQPRPVQLTAAEVARIGGITPTQDEIKSMLKALEFDVSDEGDHLLVTSPEHRIDIEGTHDLVEEVLRIYGYDRIPETLIVDELPPQRNNAALALEEQIKDTLVQLGLQEVITYRLTTPQREAQLLPGDDVPADDRPYVTLSNPITVDRVTMRHSLLASVLEVATDNSRFRERIALFELAQIYLASEDGVLPDELRRLVVVLFGPRQQSHWENGAPAAYDFYDLKGIVEGLLDALHIEAWQIEATRHPTFRPGRTARLLLGDQQLGVLGELHPLVVETLDMRTDHPVLAADLDVELLQKAVVHSRQVQPVPAYPAVHEDLALVVDAQIPAGDVTRVITDAGGFLLKDVQLFDVYEGSQLPSGKKSLAYHLTFQSPSKTLTDREVRRQRQRILKQVEKRIGASIRQ